ncbi:Transcription elongation factor spt-5 [Leucoagaricus sp. SymC.cos]|nr:Transcription elongation factor spt-5 [Leucoagaricus sp. SymC.cos]
MPIHVQQRPKKRTRANPGQHHFLDLQAVEDNEDSEEEGGGWDNLVGGVNIKKPKPFKYHEFSLPPNTDHDWELWEVPVNVGSEAAVVFEIMHRVLRLVELTKTGKSCPCTKPPRSTFVPLCMQGYILVEAWEWNDVVGICNGIPGVRWWEICHILFIDGVALLNRWLPPFSVAPGDWIRLKVAPYMNDLAFVLQTGLPRPKSAKLRRSCLEPSLEITNLPVLNAISGPLSVTEIPDPLHSTPNPPPSALALPTPIGAAPGPLELKEGDKVKVVGLTYTDLIGIIKELTPTYAYLLLLDSLASAQIPCLFLRWYYKIGDRVTIKAGVDAGLTGYIIAVNDKDDTVVICNPLVTMTQVVTPIYYVEFAADGLRFGKPPPRGPFTIAKLVDMRDPTFAHLENLHIVVTKGPLKGQSGVVKSIAITGIASIKMNALSTQVN